MAGCELAKCLVSSRLGVMAGSDREPVFAPPWLAGNRSLGTLRTEPAAVILEAPVVEHLHDVGLADVLLHDQATGHGQPRVVIGMDTCNRGRLARCLALSIDTQAGSKVLS